MYKLLLLLSFFSVFFPSFSLKTTKPKLCINCKYFIPSTTDNIYGKCEFFSEKIKTNDDLVTGKKGDIIKTFYYCSIIRSDERKCGEEGKMYKKKYTSRKKE